MLFSDAQVTSAPTRGRFSITDFAATSRYSVDDLGQIERACASRRSDERSRSRCVPVVEAIALSASRGLQCLGIGDTPQSRSPFIAMGGKDLFRGPTSVQASLGSVQANHSARRYWRAIRELPAPAHLLPAWPRTPTFPRL